MDAMIATMMDYDDDYTQDDEYTQDEYENDIATHIDNHNQKISYNMTRAAYIYVGAVDMMLNDDDY